MSHNSHETTAEHERKLIANALEDAAAFESARRRALPPEDAVEGYRIINEIGRGGMGVVYRALQLATRRPVALKLMVAGPFASLAVQRRFQREVELAARLTHPAIVRLLESGRTATGQLYYAMDFVTGVTLDCHAAYYGPDTRAVLHLFIALCDGVEHAHLHDVIHRDLKPANVLVDDEGRPHIVDFGLAKAVDDDDLVGTLTIGCTSPGQVLGTLRYLSPEQAAGLPEQVDCRTDVYALGVMLYEALTGRLPVERGRDPSDVLRRIREDVPPPPSTVSSRVDRELETIVLKALEKDGSRRYASVTELREDLRRYHCGEPILAHPPSRLYRWRKRFHKHRMVAALSLAAVVMAGAGVGIGVRWRTTGDRQRAARELDAARDDAATILRDIEAGRLDEALTMSGTLFQNHPGLPETRLVYAQAHFRHGRRYAIEKYETMGINALEDAPPDAAFHWVYDSLLAEFYELTGSDLAESVAARARQDASESASAYYLMSFATLDADKAADLVETSLQNDPGNRRALRRLAHLLLVTGRFDRARDAAQRLIDDGADEAEWMGFRAHALLIQGRYQQAVAEYTRLIESTTQGYWVFRGRAVARMCLGDYEQAVADLTRAVRAAPDSPYNLYIRATCNWICGRVAEACNDYREFRSMTHQSTLADARLFLALRDLGHHEESRGHLAQADRLAAQANAAFTQGRRGAVKGAWLANVLACLAGELTPEQLVSRADPMSEERTCEAYYYAGEACLLSGSIDQAREWFERCVATHLALDRNTFPPDPMNEYHLARWRLAHLKKT